ncbi:MAG: YHS domain-containing protein [Chloroflexota bacterium]
MSEFSSETPQPEVVKTVCGGRLKEPSKYPQAVYRGERVYFCTQACLRAFEREPDLFMSGEIEHPLDDD